MKAWFLSDSGSLVTLSKIEKLKRAPLCINKSHVRNIKEILPPANILGLRIGDGVDKVFFFPF
jgi:hypothetical protein